jgi:phage-related minor tail protein
MSQFARVESVDALRQFKEALAKFSDAARSALTDADGELQRVLNWVQNEQATYWKAQVQKRHQAVMHARDAVRQKQLFRTELQGKDSAAEEKKALSIAQRALDEAEQKVVATRQWGQKLAQDIIIYRGLSQRMSNQAEIRIPEARARLDRMIAALDAYLALEAPQLAPTGSGGTEGIGGEIPEGAAAAEAGGSVSRGGEEAGQTMGGTPQEKRGSASDNDKGAKP